MLAQPSYYKYGASAWDTIFIVFINSCMVRNIIKQNKVVKVAGCRCTRHNAIATIDTYIVDQQLQNTTEGRHKHLLCEQPIKFDCKIDYCKPLLLSDMERKQTIYWPLKCFYFVCLFVFLPVYPNVSQQILMHAIICA